jgi:hypothetical protein
MEGSDHLAILLLEKQHLVPTGKEAGWALKSMWIGGKKKNLCPCQLQVQELFN